MNQTAYFDTVIIDKRPSKSYWMNYQLKISISSQLTNKPFPPIHKALSDIVQVTGYFQTCSNN